MFYHWKPWAHADWPAESLHEGCQTLLNSLPQRETGPEGWTGHDACLDWYGLRQLNLSDRFANALEKRWVFWYSLRYPSGGALGPALRAATHDGL